MPDADPAGTPRASQVAELNRSAKIAVGQFTGARADDDVVFTRDISDAIDLLTRGLPAGAEVLVLDVDDHTGPAARRAGSPPTRAVGPHHG